MRGSIGTYTFFSPELCNPEISEYSGCAADVWALGMTLYDLVYRKPPYKADNEIDLLDEVLTHELKFENRNITDGLRELITGLL